jgi:glutamate 5-kinase
MTNKDNRIVKPILDHLVQQIAELYERNIMSVLV